MTERINPVLYALYGRYVGRHVQIEDDYGTQLIGKLTAINPDALSPDAIWLFEINGVRQPGHWYMTGGER